MPLVSVTRLRLRAWRYLPAFMILAMRSTEQVRRAPGLVSGWIGGERLRGFWTVTVWEDLAAMRAFRNAERHHRGRQPATARTGGDPGAVTRGGRSPGT